MTGRPLFCSSRRTLLFCLLVYGCLSAFTMQPAAAQQESQAENAATSVNEKANLSNHVKSSQPDRETGKKKRESRGALVIAPLPIVSPALGSGFTPVVAYIFPLQTSDKISPPSVIGAAGLITDNGSRGIALGGEFYFKQNRFQTTAIYLRGNLNYDLYGLGAGTWQSRLPLKQTGQAFFGEFLRRIGWNFFLGPRFLTGSSLITIRNVNSDNSSVPPDVGLNTALTALGFRLERDTRPNRFYPTKGSLLDFRADFFAQVLGSKYSFQSYQLTFNKYVSLSPKQVLAYNAYGCITGGQPPFYGNCRYGTNNELRGYVAGRYLDRYMLATQLEYRLALPKRFGVVAFGGVGEVIPGGNQPFRVTNFLPSAGGGVRFEMSKKYHVNLRIDVAQGRDSNTWSIGVGEAF
jgi:Omp85 superfamily domain